MGVQLNPGGEARIKAMFDRQAGYEGLYRKCRAAFRRPDAAAESALSRTGVERLSVLAADECAKLRQMIDVGSGFLKKRIFQVALLEKIFTPEVDARIANHFGSEYLPLWCRFYRNDPEGEPGVSFAWHCDGGPTAHLKLLLYLNDADEHGGGTQFLDRETTDAFKTIAYVYCDTSQRVADLSGLAREHGLPYDPHQWPMRTGEAMLFEPTNILHRGLWPVAGPRYLLQVCIVPSPLPWREACERYAIPRPDTDWPIADADWPAEAADLL